MTKRIRRDKVRTNSTPVQLGLEQLECRTLPALVAAFGFEEGAGSSAFDASGNGLTGSVSGAAWSAAGRHGGALVFDGVNDWVTVADHALLDLTTGMTVSAWVRPTSAAADWTTVALKERPGGMAYGLYAADGAGRPPAGYVHRNGDQAAAAGSALPLNAWTHLAATYNGSALTLYVNGAQAGSRSVSGAVAASIGALRIGGNAVWGESFAGLIDEVRVYNNALTAAQIQADMSTPVVGAPDTIPPTVALTGPANGATLSGTVAVAASATDNVGVAGVQFLLNGNPLGAEDTTAPYAVNWATTGVANGTYTLTARARDAAGNTTVATAVSVTVDNGAPDTTPPEVALTAPGNGATVSGTATVAATATDNVGVAGVQFLLNGNPLGAEDTTAPYAVSWGTTAVANGNYVLTARARDAAGNTTLSTSVTVTVANTAPDTTPPTVSMTGPNNGSTVSGAVTASASATDNVGVAGVQFLLNGNPLGAEDTSAPYAVNWATTGVANGNYTLTARARDAAGNTATAASVTVTVNNGGGAQLTIDGARTFQTMDGFGVNANVNSWGPALHPAVDALVEDMGASLWRVYIDNTNWETTNDNSDPFTFNWDYYNTLYATPRFEQAWGMLAELNSHGVTDGIVLNFMGPGPSWMGGSDLSSAQEDEWVEMILSYVVYARENRGLDFYRIAPFNELDWDGKEGIRANAQQMTRVLGKMAARLDALGMEDIRFAGPETASADSATNQYIPAMLANPTVMAKVEDFAFHNYAGYSAGAGDLIAESAYPDRGYWVSEQSFGGGWDLAPINNLMNHIEDGATATLVFKAYDGQDNHHPPGEDFALGTMQYNQGTQTYTPRKNYYVQKQVQKYIRPGAVRIAADESIGGVRIFSFLHPVTGQLTILGLNTNGGSVNVSGALANLAAVPAFEFSYTTGTSNNVRGADVTVSGGQFFFTAPGNSVFTLTYSGIPDTTPPTVALTAPANGSTVSGAATVAATADDNVGVAGVQFLLDGNPLGAEDTTAPYAVSWGTTAVANGNYVLTAVARDAAGNTASSNVTVTVDNGTPDTIPPEVALTAPANGSTVSGAVTVSANASDNVSVAGVQFLLNGNPLGAEDTTAPYAVSWGTTAVANGNYVLTAVARDAAGNTASSNVTVTVDNGTPDTTPPEVALTAPSNGATVSGTVSVSASATDNIGVAGVQFFLDSISLGAEDTTAPYAVSWATIGVANGTYTLTARARDAAGNATVSASITITVNNAAPDTTPPTVALTGPNNGSTVSGTVTVSASATDNVGVAGVQFLLNGVNLGVEDVTAPYSVNWVTTAIANGTYTLTARARDAAGNTATATSITVTVSNAAASGLVAAYGFEEGSGGTARDVSGNNLNGTISGASWSAAGRHGGALSFDGINDWVTVADHALLDLTTGMTVSAWVRPAAAAADWTTVALKERPGGMAYGLYTADGAGRPPAGYVHRNGDQAAVGSSPLSVGTWVHLAVTYGGGALRLYVNGVQSATRSVSGTVTTSTGVLRIGGNAVWGEYFNGLIDEVRIYNRAQSQAEIQTDMNTPVGGGSGGLAASEVPQDSTAPSPLGPNELEAMRAEAVARWQASGVSVSDLSALNGLQFRVADLPGSQLGFTSGNTIWIDPNAAGWGWFLDPMPGDDVEFNPPLQPAVVGQIDLLSVVTHEIGHALGFEHEEAGAMTEIISPGERHMPEAPAAREEESASHSAPLAIDLPLAIPAKDSSRSTAEAPRGVRVTEARIEVRVAQLLGLASDPSAPKRSPTQTTGRGERVDFFLEGRRADNDLNRFWLAFKEDEHDLDGLN